MGRSSSESQSEAETIAWGSSSLPLPTFFASVSSVKTNFSLREYLKVLTVAGTAPLLVSAYDVVNCDTGRGDALGLVEQAVAAGHPVVVDSGNYEKYWHRDSAWTVREFASVLGELRVPYAFCYDNQEPPEDPRKAADDVVAAVERDQKNAPGTSILPIVHGDPSTMPDVCAAVASRLRPPLLAVPERELGSGLTQRLSTVRRIVHALQQIPTATRLHLLGTGNPLSLLLFSNAGASTFDGLEWCQTCVEPRSARLYHFQQRELVAEDLSEGWGELSYPVATLVHNLQFYARWMRLLRESKSGGMLQEMVREFAGVRGCQI